MDAAERAALAAGHEAARRLAAAEDADGYADANRVFRLAIHDGARNPALVETTPDVRRRLAPGRRAQFQAMSRPPASWTEHDAVVRAKRAGEGDAACLAMRSPILKVKDAYRAYAHDDAAPPG